MGNVRRFFGRSLALPPSSPLPAISRGRKEEWQGNAAATILAIGLMEITSGAVSSKAVRIFSLNKKRGHYATRAPEVHQEIIGGARPNRRVYP